jgi:hypothetical protein
LTQGGILISSDFLGERIDEVVESHKASVGEEVLKALFASETIKKNKTRFRKNHTLRAKIVQLSIESGVLCGETAFGGVSDEIFQTQCTDLEKDEIEHMLSHQIQLITVCGGPSSVCHSDLESSSVFGSIFSAISGSSNRQRRAIRCWC